MAQLRAFDLDPSIINTCHVYLALLILDILLVYQTFVSLRLFKMEGKKCALQFSVHLWSRWLTLVLPVTSALVKLDLKAMR